MLAMCPVLLQPSSPPLFSFYHQIQITIKQDTTQKQRNVCQPQECTLNNSLPSTDFRIELEENDRLPLLGIKIIHGFWFDSIKKPTDTGQLLQYHRNIDKRYKQSLLNIMLNSHLPERVFLR